MNHNPIISNLHNQNLDNIVKNVTILLSSASKPVASFYLANILLCNGNIQDALIEFNQIKHSEMIRKILVFSVQNLRTFFATLKVNEQQLQLSANCLFSVYGVELTLKKPIKYATHVIKNSITNFENLAFSDEGWEIMESFYTELLIRHGSSARVYWYRANIRKIQNKISDYISDLEKMNLVDPNFLLEYLKNYDAALDYCDIDIVAFIQWTLVSTVVGVRKSLPQHRKNVSINSSKNEDSRCENDYHPKSAAKNHPIDIELCFSLFREFYSLILFQGNLSLTSLEKSHIHACLGDLYREEFCFEAAKSEFNDSLYFDPTNLIAHAGLALLSIGMLEIDNALRHCNNGFKCYQQKYQLHELLDDERSHLFKVYSSNVVVQEALVSCAQFVFLQQIHSKKQDPRIKMRNLDYHPQKNRQGGLMNAVEALDRQDHLRMSISALQMSILLAIYSFCLQLHADLVSAEQILQLAINVNQQCVYSRFQMFLFDVRFGSTSAASLQLKAIEKLFPCFDLNIDFISGAFYRLTSFMKESPRFWNYLYPQYLPYPETESIGRPKPPLKDPAEIFVLIFKNLASNNLHDLVNSLELYQKNVAELSLFSKLVQVYPQNNFVESAGSTNKFIWELISRGKRIQEIGDFDFLAFIEYSIAAKVANSEAVFELHWRRGLLFRRKKNFARALDDFSLAIDLVMQKLRTDKVLDSKKREIFTKLFAEKIEMFMVLKGATLYDTGHYLSAAEAFSKILQMNSLNTTALHYRSLCYSHLNKYDAALKDLDQLCSVQPNDLGNLIRFGNLLTRVGSYPESMNLFCKIETLAPDSPQIMFGIANLYFRMGNFAASEVYFKKWCFF